MGIKYLENLQQVKIKKKGRDTHPYRVDVCHIVDLYVKELKRRGHMLL